MSRLRLDRQISDWLEQHWVSPAYGGWLLMGLACFFFAAATNTMAGWLYVISGIMGGLLGIAALLPGRSLQGIRVQRRPIEAVSAGDDLMVTLQIENLTPRHKLLIQVRDQVPYVLTAPAVTAMEVLPAGDTHVWTYRLPTRQRGIYRWHTVQIRTAAPLGLFWSRRCHTVQAMATVYPTVLPLAQCPLVDDLGQTVNDYVQNSYQAIGATEGLTRALRPYRWGDPTRLVHWRTSARYGELRVRELETYTGGQEVLIGLDTAIAWQPEAFEQAVIAAASLYIYARQRGLQVSLWTTSTGRVEGEQAVLMALAAVHPEQVLQPHDFPHHSLIWLSQTPDSLNELPDGSRWLLWPPSPSTRVGGTDPSLGHYPGLVMQPEQPLQDLLQSPLSGYRTGR